MTAEWTYEPGFHFAVAHTVGEMSIALDLGFGLRLQNRQLMFMVRTRAPREWVSLSGSEVRLLDSILDFFESHNVYFGASRDLHWGSATKVVLCRQEDYEEFVRALDGYSDLTIDDQDTAEELLEKSASSMTKQAYMLAQIVTTFVDEANVISKADDRSPYRDLDELDPTESDPGQRQNEQVEVEIQSILEVRQSLIDELDSFLT